ncbi:MAG: ATP-binding protein [Bacteroidota bacterium]
MTPESPFKGLDAYTRADGERFFGRDREITELYNRVQSGKLTLIYGLSGTGKSSLVRCGLANRFRSREWFPVYVRRGEDITAALTTALYDAWRAEADKQVGAAAGAGERTERSSSRRRLLRRKAPATPPPSLEDFIALGDLEERIERVYYAVYRPIFFVFDQFEELYTINPFRKGEAYDAEASDRWETEKHTFYRSVRDLLDSTRVSARLIFILREEWWARMNVFEEYVPELNENRMRLERMNDREMGEVIRQTAAFSQHNPAFRTVQLQEPVVVDILTTIRDERDFSLDLVDLQLYLDRLLEKVPAEGPAIFTPALVKDNQLDNVIDDFLSTSLEAIEKELIGRWRAAEPTAERGKLAGRAKGIPLEILFRLVTDEGTKKVTAEEELLDHPFFQRRSITPEDIRFCLQRLAENKLINSYDS